MWKVVLSFVLAAVVAGCGSKDVEKKDAPPTEKKQKVREEPAEPEFVVIRRTTRLHVAPDETSPFVQFRTAETQSKLDTRRREAAEERAEEEKEEEEEFREREEERAKRLRKRYRRKSWKRRKKMREREKERAERIARERAADKIEQINRLAHRYAGEAQHQRLIAMRYVGESGEWVEVETIPGRALGAHCYHGVLNRLTPLKLRFFVHRERLLNVTTKRVRVPVRRGTEVTLASGVAMEPNGDAWRTIVDGFVLDLEVPDRAVGKTYTLSSRFEAPRTDTVFTSQALLDGHLRLGRGQSLAYNPYNPLHVTATLWVGSRFYATTQTQCGEYTVRVEEEDLEPVGQRGAQRFGAGDDEVVEPYALPGAKIYSPDGREIGEVVTNYSLQEDVGTKNDRRCFRQLLWEEGAAARPDIVLCFDASDVKGVDMNVWGEN